MLNKEEKEILFSYNLMEPIKILDYITDFVLNNPSNYPISSSIMKFAKFENQTILKSYYTRENIKSCIKRLYNLYDVEDARFEHQHNFTSTLMYIFLITGQDDYHFSIIEKNDNDIWVAINIVNLHCMFIFNSNCTNGLYIISNDDYYQFVLSLNNKSVDDALNSEILHSFYKFPIDDMIIFNDDSTEMDKYLDRYELLMRFISGKAVKDITINKDFKNSEYFSNLSVERSIIYIIKHNHSYDIRHFSQQPNKIDNRYKYQQEITKDADPIFDKYI